MLPDLLKKNIDSLIAAIIGLLIVLLFSNYGGIGISPDSITYTSVARNLISGSGFTEYSGSPLVSFPLFYPLFLGFIMFLTQHDIIQIAPFLNGLMFASLIFLSGVILEQFKYKTKIYKRILLLITILSPSLIEVYSMLWSETLFILLILIFIYLFRRYFIKHTILSLVIAAIVASIAFDTRYAGITLVATGAVLIFFDKNLKWSKKTIHILLFGSIGISLVVINLIRNVFENELATGMRQEGITSLEKNIEYTGTIFSDWINIQFEGKWIFEILAILVLILFVFFFIRNIRHWKSYYMFENITVSFFIVYVLFIIISSTFSRYETINNRLLAPAFLPLLWVSTCQIPKWRNSIPHKKLNWIFFAFSLGIGFYLISGYVSINRDNLSYMNETGIPGFSEDTWTKSKLVRYLQKNNEVFKEGLPIYSNHCEAVYFLTGHTVNTIPERVYMKNVEEFKSTKMSLLIWFNLDPDPEILNLKEIKKYKKMTRIKVFSDGGIFKLENLKAEN